MNVQEQDESELQAKSRSYKPKVRVTGGQTAGIRTESSEASKRVEAA